MLISKKISYGLGTKLFCIESQYISFYHHLWQNIPPTQRMKEVAPTNVLTLSYYIATCKGNIHVGL
jgi:hypothetical protein